MSYPRCEVPEHDNLEAENERLRAGIRAVADEMDRDTPTHTLVWEDDLRALLDGAADEVERLRGIERAARRYVEADHGSPEWDAAWDDLNIALARR